MFVRGRGGASVLQAGRRGNGWRLHRLEFARLLGRTGVLGLEGAWAGGMMMGSALWLPQRVRGAARRFRVAM